MYDYDVWLWWWWYMMQDDDDIWLIYVKCWSHVGAILGHHQSLYPFSFTAEAKERRLLLPWLCLSGRNRLPRCDVCWTLGGRRSPWFDWCIHIWWITSRCTSYHEPWKWKMAFSKMSYLQECGSFPLPWLWEECWMCHCAETRVVLRILTHAGQRLLICVTILASCPYDQRNFYFTLLDASELTAFPMSSSAFNSDDHCSSWKNSCHQFLIYETLRKHGMFSIYQLVTAGFLPLTIITQNFIST